MTRIADTRAVSQGFLLDGQWLSEGEVLEVRSPFDHHLIGTTFRPRTSHIEMAIQAAVRAFDVTRKLPSYERQRVLQSVAQGITDRREDFARTIALEAGKPIRTARAEVERAIFTFNIAAEESTRIYGQWLPGRCDHTSRRRPGICRRTVYNWRLFLRRAELHFRAANLCSLEHHGRFSGCLPAARSKAQHGRPPG
jgi:hypothetical protein